MGPDTGRASVLAMPAYRPRREGRLGSEQFAVFTEYGGRRWRQAAREPSASIFERGDQQTTRKRPSPKIKRVRQKPAGHYLQSRFKLVGATRFELATPCTPCKCATRLRHAPTVPS